MPQVKLTIVTVCFNDLANLRRTIDSVAASLINIQGKFVEHIIIDGGSTDGTIEFLTEHCRHVSYPTSFVSENDSGIYDAMNKGIKYASGEFVQFLNAGDTLIVCNFKQVLYFLQNTSDSIGFVCFGYLKVAQSLDETLVLPLSRVSNIFLRMPTSHQAIFYRLEILNLLPFDPNFTISGDFNHLCKLITSGIEYKAVPFASIRFYIGGVSSQFRWKLFFQSCRSILRYNLPILVPVRLLVLALRVFR